MFHPFCRLRVHSLASTLCLSWLGACSAPEGKSLQFDEEAPLYLATSWVTDAEQTNTYVAIFDSLDVDRLDFADALELPGFGDAWVEGGAIFMASGDAPKVGRYHLDANGVPVLEREIDFSSYGGLGAAFWDQQFLTAEKAYLSNVAAHEYVVWNPKTMEITGTLPWPEFDFAGGLEVYNSYTDRGGVVHDGHYFHGFYGTDENFLAFGDRSYVAVYEIETDELVEVIEVPCPMMDVASLGDDGYIYVSGWSYVPLSHIAGYSPKNCAARIDPETRSLDPSWLLDYAAVTPGEQGSALRAVAGNDAVFAVFHGTGVEVTEGMDIWDLDVGANDWELYSLDLKTNEARPSGIQMSDGSYYESHVDDRYFVYLGDSKGDSVVHERTPTGYERRFEAQGWMSRLFRLR